MHTVRTQGASGTPEGSPEPVPISDRILPPEANHVRALSPQVKLCPRGRLFQDGQREKLKEELRIRFRLAQIEENSVTFKWVAHR